MQVMTLFGWATFDCLIKWPWRLFFFADQWNLGLAEGKAQCQLPLKCTADIALRNARRPNLTYFNFFGFRPQSSACAFLWAKLGCMPNFKFINGPIDLRTTRLNYILQDLFRDTPLDQIWSAQICIFGQKCIFGRIFGHWSLPTWGTLCRTRRWVRCCECCTDGEKIPWN